MTLPTAIGGSSPSSPTFGDERALRGSVVALLFGLAACGEASNKAAGPDKPVELVITNNDSGSGVRTTPAAGYFVDRVGELSGGKLVIREEIAPWATDGQEIRDVAAGRADLGWTGTRVFDLLGVDELSPLHAPFLIDSYELQAAVLESDIPDQMLAALERLDVEPLAILGDGLRFPAAARSPLVAARDWQGAGIWLLDSAIQSEAVKALGGTPINGGDVRQMLPDGTARGLENMWIYYTLGSDFLYAPYVTPNAVLSPRTTALFGNPESLARLDDTQRGWIRQAAEDTTKWSSATCRRQGGRLRPGGLQVRHAGRVRVARGSSRACGRRSNPSMPGCAATTRRPRASRRSRR